MFVCHMPVSFTSFLTDTGLEPADVRLLRHKDNRSDRGRGPYELWRDKLKLFNEYQSTQSPNNRSRLGSKYWASFVGAPNGETLFVGVYSVGFIGKNKKRLRQVHRDGTIAAGKIDVYRTRQTKFLEEYIGRLVIDWGSGERCWIQRADKQPKSVIEIRPEFKESAFPGYMRFREPLSWIEKLPSDWIQALKNARGVYVLTCPRTREQYVGSATGAGGFWQRWCDYLLNGHGGNVGLKSRKPSDYQVGVLEVAGSCSNEDDIRTMESNWKKKLQTREMGLTKN